ncbi:CRAL-TRIO domain-containing protein [Helicostylum pulchrum]|uniref:CRAL-TRIO domain-containing protein n=1 Tax=Helicostylum pulchrum TaxID=562976 RepID=A0ABP9Y8F2_9FUNG|nr:CRAL-TRIO domain-containing protein [Helicostylum pulchrum]
MNVFKFKSGSSSASTKSAATSINYGPITNEPILTAPKDYEPAMNAPLTEEQTQKIKDLLAYMDTIILSKEDAYYPNERGFLSDATAHRYMRARKWNFEAAKTMLEKTVHWRREFKPEQLDPDTISKEAETGKMYFNGYDKMGRPLWIMKPRYENSKDSDGQVNFIVFCLERGIRLMPEHVEKISIVVDFKDSSMSNNPTVATCRRFLDILSNHYPERLGVAYLINSPWFFTTTFKMIAPFMDPITKEKIRFLSTDANVEDQDLAKSDGPIALDQLEAGLGGRYNFAFDMPTYWNRLLETTGKPYKVIEYK